MSDQPDKEELTGLILHVLCEALNELPGTQEHQICTVAALAMIGIAKLEPKEARDQLCQSMIDELNDMISGKSKFLHNDEVEVLH